MALGSIIKSLAAAAGLPLVTRGEAQPRPGPWLTSQGWLPTEWGQWANFWQMGYDPLPFSGNAVVDACVWAYVRAIAQLPGVHRELLENGGIEPVTTSALSRLLRTPNSYQTSSDFLTHTVRSLLYDGNSYSLAVRNARNEVVELHWMRPSLCSVIPIAIEGQFQKEVFYALGENPLLTPDTIGQQLLIPARDVLHIKLATPRDPLKGETWLSSLAIDLMNRGAISASINRFITNASRPSGVITTDMTLTKDQVIELRERWNEQARGMGQGGVPILTHGLKWQPMGMTNADAQLVEALKLTDKTIVGVFGVPGILVGVQDGAPFASTETLMNYWLSNGLGYLLDHIETAIDQFIGLPAAEWTEYDTDALLRMNTRERIESLVRGVQGAIYAPNEARAREGLPAKQYGEEPRVQQQVVPLSFAATSRPAKPPPPAPSAASPVTPPDQAAPDAGGGSGDQPPPAPPTSRGYYERQLWADWSDADAA